MKKWWQEEHLAENWRPPHLLPTAALLGGAAAFSTGGCAILQMRDEMDVEVDAQSLQQRQGWNVGQPAEPLEMDGATLKDVDDSDRWRDIARTLPQTMAPAQANLAPFYTPTLFQALVHPMNEQLRQMISPLVTNEMRGAFARGQALASLFGEVGWPTDTAVIIDVPGPQAVAMAAGMADHFEPVFTFDNWPHPAGVVPSHETLAATLYYAPLFERTKASRPQPAAPVFVLDRDRLDPYEDDEETFDNRYWAKLPTAENFAALGIKHVMYVNPSRNDSGELDDLNDEFVALDQAGIDVKTVALSDFAEQIDEAQPVYAWNVGWNVNFYFGGCSWWHHHFWDLYGWHCPPGRPPIGMPPPQVSDGCHYHVLPRRTIFTGAPPRGTPARMQWKPASFARVQTRTSRWDGRLTGVRFGRSFVTPHASFTRSGSLGRIGASFVGG
jgi:hypothetical protein